MHAHLASIPYLPHYRRTYNTNKRACISGITKRIFIHVRHKKLHVTHSKQTYVCTSRVCTSRVCTCMCMHTRREQCRGSAAMAGGVVSPQRVSGWWSYWSYNGLTHICFFNFFYEILVIFYGQQAGCIVFVSAHICVLVPSTHSYTHILISMHSCT